MTSETSRERPADAPDLVFADLVAALRRAHQSCDTTSDNRPGGEEDARHLAWVMTSTVGSAGDVRD